MDGVDATSDLLFAADRVHFTGEIYAVGTVNVQNGSKDVTGTGTSWLGNIAAGDWFTGPDGRTYEIATVTGNGALVLKATYRGQTDTNEGYGIAPANPLMTVYSEDTVEDGVTIPKGVYINRALLRKADIWDLVVQDRAQSSNYAEDANGLPTSGWLLKKNGTIKTAGAVISRQLQLAAGSFVHPGSIGAGGAIDIPLVNTGVRVGDNDVWTTSRRTFQATVRVLPASASGAGTGSLWGATAQVFNGFAWNGAPNWDAAKGLQYEWSRDPATLISPPWASGTGQRILMNIRAFTSLITVHGPLTIHWKLYEVT